MTVQLFLLTLATMIAFAANSIFCRLALIDPANDPLSFTLVRLFSGAVFLALFFVKHYKLEPIQIKASTFLAPTLLFTYALFFSLAYVKIDSGTGALILFACVQLTMMTSAIFQGQKFNTFEKIGILMAVGGFIYLLIPGANMPPVQSAVLMAISGASWGIYSLLGKQNSNPIFSTARNFIFTAPLVIILVLIFSLKLTSNGIMWAILSGGLTSGLGYVLWYLVLKDLATSTAAIIQLSVPALAAFGGVLFLNESISSRLLIASLLIFSGITLNVRAKH